jgi:hypothetical protein
MSRSISCYLFGVNLIVMHGNLMTAHGRSDLLMSQFAGIILWKVKLLFPDKPASDIPVNTSRYGCVKVGTTFMRGF